MILCLGKKNVKELRFNFVTDEYQIFWNNKMVQRFPSDKEYYLIARTYNEIDIDGPIHKEAIDQILNLKKDWKDSMIPTFPNLFPSDLLNSIERLEICMNSANKSE